MLGTEAAETVAAAPLAAVVPVAAVAPLADAAAPDALPRPSCLRVCSSECMKVCNFVAAVGLLTAVPAAPAAALVPLVALAEPAVPVTPLVAVAPAVPVDALATDACALTACCRDCSAPLSRFCPAPTGSCPIVEPEPLSASPARPFLRPLLEKLTCAGVTEPD